MFVLHTALVILQNTSESDSSWLLLLAGPAGATAVYMGLYQYYRNTDKSHDFERETAIESQPVTGQDRKVDKVRGTKRTRINGDNIDDHRERVRRLD